MYFIISVLSVDQNLQVAAETKNVCVTYSQGIKIALPQRKEKCQRGPLIKWEPQAVEHCELSAVCKFLSAVSYALFTGI